MNPGHLAMPFGVVGFLIGGLIGFMMRPSVVLIGQLPFGTIITRGAYLTGLETLLQPTAETSFNQMLTAAALGALASILLGLLTRTVPRRG